MESEQLAYVMITTYGIMLVSYFCTSLLDPGIIKPSEDNSIENKPVLEPLGCTVLLVAITARTVEPVSISSFFSVSCHL